MYSMKIVQTQLQLLLETLHCKSISYFTVISFIIILIELHF